MTPPWNPALGASGGGGGTGACCCVGNNGMNLPGAAFWCPTTGCWLAVGRTAMATAAASDANPMTANAMTALPINTDRRLSGAGPAAASSSSTSSPPYSSLPNGSPSSASEYANCESAAAGSGAGANAVSSPAAGIIGAAREREVWTLQNLHPQRRSRAQLVGDPGQVGQGAHHVCSTHRERRGAEPVQHHVDGCGGGVHALQRHCGQDGRRPPDGAQRQQCRRLRADHERYPTGYRSAAKDGLQQRLHRFRLGNQPDVVDSGARQRLLKRLSL